MVLCELCGRSVSEAFRVELLGSVVNACRGCSGSGRVIGPAVEKPKPKPAATARKDKPAVLEDGDWELVEDYASIVKKAREREGLKQEEFAKKINEPASVVHRIESGHMRPNPSVVKKIEKTLKVKLMAAASTGEADYKSGGGGDTTLGDVIVVREKKE